MADSRSYNQPSTHTVTHHKSFIRIICKSLFFVLFLIAIPLFPSQAPNFVNQTLLTKFWELVHLLFIGVAVSYGLFSSRNVEGEFETTTQYSTCDFDDLQSSNNYVSRIFHVSPIFENGYENLSGSDEKNVYHTWNSQSYKDESSVTVTNGSSSSIDEKRKHGFIDHENGNEIPVEHDENTGVQTWNSQYLQGESVVVLSQVNYELDEWGKPSQIAGCKPLGLPVRSLKSRIRNPDTPHFSDGSESGSSLIGDSNSSGRTMNEKIFGDMGPINLEEKFNENFALHSQVPRRSRSGRVELRNKVGRVAPHPSHFRPLSVDETQFESLRSQSFRSTTSFSSQASSVSNSPTMLSPSHSTTSSDSPSSRTEELGKDKDFFPSYPPASQSPQTTKTRDAPLNAFHLRRYSSGSLFQKDAHKRIKDEPKDLRGKRKDDLLRSKEGGQGTLESDKKPAMMVKASPRGKSVRTIRSVYTAEAATVGETCIDDQAGKEYNEAIGENIGKIEMKREGSGKYDVPTGMGKKNLDGQYDVPKPTFGKYQMKEKEEPLETVTVEAEEDPQRETDRSGMGSHADAVLNPVSDAGHDPGEVDRKAGEFIAKFREQIRLQKVASVERSKGLRLSGKHLR
ncbi:uncharacterized protein LOC8265800 [Ricinus communis]|uniref:uncharacterized protein LOC8265800 n=1 Tax=Ricinus communis TaxID=3988 RepID=UPI00201A7789|nr:uncharacterized protein LOC8265800 [Ricinus communis]